MRRSFPRRDAAPQKGYCVPVATCCRHVCWRPTAGASFPGTVRIRPCCGGAPIPDPRCVLPLEDFHLPRRSARALRNRPFELRMDTAFSRVIRACAAPRRDSEGTWILPEMIAAYERLHALGYAHSVEAWRDGELLGGLYGVALGRAFFGESMFHRCPEASRAALAGLVAFLRGRDFLLLDCQQATPHMLAMGARDIPRREFLALLRQAVPVPDPEPVSQLPWLPWRMSFRYDAALGWIPDER